jgi:PAS domain S-box-containing protein
MGESLRALIVEKSENGALQLINELERGGINLAYERADTVDGLSRALRGAEWDVVIADISTLGPGTKDALELVQQNGLDVPIILVADAGREDQAIQAMRAGVQDYVLKDRLMRLGPAVRREMREAQFRKSHRQVTDALSESQAWYRSLVETSPDALIVTDLEGRLLMANRRAAELRGCASEEELLGQNVFDFLVPEDRLRAYQDGIETIQKRRPKNLEYTMLRQDGSELSVELSASVVKVTEDKPRAFVAVLRDITSRVKAREEISRLKEFNEGILQNVAEGIVLQDAEGYLTYVNPAAAALLGYTTEEMLGMHGSAITMPEHQHIIEAADQRREEGLSDRYEIDLQSKHGSPVTVLVSGRPRFDAETGEFIGTIATFTDITERKSTERVLLRRNRELDLLNRVSRALSVILDQQQLYLTILDEVRQALDVAAASIWLIDSDTGELVCLEATGSERETVRGWRLEPGEGIAGWAASRGKSVIVPDTRTDPRHFKGVDQQIGLGVRSIMSVPMRARRDVIGVLQVVDTTVNRFRPSDMTLIEPLAATAAIAIENARLFAREEQRAAELASALEQRQELDRLKDQFIQNVSHELRTPLGLIQAYAQLLVEGDLGELKPNQYEPISVIARRTQALTKIVDDLTAIWETEAKRAQSERVDFADLVQNLLPDFKIAAESAGLSLDVQVEPNLPPTLGDATHLGQMLDNLLGNALKFTPSGGTVSVLLHHDGDSLILRVADTGVGIPADQIDRVFERFYQVDGSMSRRYGGAGLGLALVKDVVEAHGGTVFLESTEGSGSTFTVTLPEMSTVP